MKKYTSLSLLLLLLICFTSLSGQTITPTEAANKNNLVEHYQQLYKDHDGDAQKLKGTGFNPFQRLKQFHDRRVMSDGTLQFGKRMELYQSAIEQESDNKSGAPQADWQSIGPDLMDTYSGRVVSHAFDPNDPDKLWVGSASGGLWLTEDRGENWTSMTDDIPSSGVGAVATHPTDSDKIIIGTGEGFRTVGIVFKPGMGIFRSEDGGKTWLTTNQSYSLQADVSYLDMVWDPVNTNVIWAAGTNGLWKSEDEGANWVLKLGDGTNHGNFIIDDIIIQKDDPSIIFIAIENKGIYKSIDGGENFIQLQNGLPLANINMINIAQAETNPNVLYTSIIARPNFNLEGVYKSVDHGASWTKLPSAPDAPCSPQLIGFCQGWYNNFIAVSPFDENLVSFGGVTMWMSDDGGTTWDQKDRLICPTCGIPPACTMWGDHHDFAFSPHDENVMYSLCDGGVAISEDRGDCFTDKNNKLIAAQFVAASVSRSDPNIVIGGLYDHGLHGVDLNEGKVWKKWGWFDGADVEVHSNDPDIFYGTWIDGTYWKYKKGVDIWAKQITSGINLTENATQFWAPLAIHPTDGLILLGSTQQRLYRSETAGNTWSPVLSANAVTDVRFSEANPDIAYAAAWNSNSWTFYRSEDKGLTWTQTMSAPGWRMTDIKTSAQDPMTVFVSRNSTFSNNPHVYKSTDGGETWISIQGNMPDITVNAIEVDRRDHSIVYCATDLGVFITEDDGINWTLFNDGMPITYAYDLQYSPMDTTLIVATLGRGAWRTKLEKLNTTNIIEPVNAIAFNLYPNPTSDELNITLDAKKSGEMEIQLLDVLGQTMSNLYFSRVNSGKLNLNFSITELKLNTGIYYVQINFEKRRYTKKLLIQM